MATWEIERPLRGALGEAASITKAVGGSLLGVLGEEQQRGLMQLRGWEGDEEQGKESRRQLKFGFSSSWGSLGGFEQGGDIIKLVFLKDSSG